MDWYKVPSKADEEEFNKSLIRLVRVTKFLERRLTQAAQEGDQTLKHLQEYRLTLMIANRTIKAWEDALRIET
jgi:hypothetical protein